MFCTAATTPHSVEYAVVKPRVKTHDRYPNESIQIPPWHSDEDGISRVGYVRFVAVTLGTSRTHPLRALCFFYCYFILVFVRLGLI